MTEQTYSFKSIRLTMTLDTTGGGNQFSFEDFACHVSISKTGGVDFAKAAVEIYGLSLETMAKLTALSFRPLARRNNLLQIEAGEKGGTLSVIFQGEVTTSFADLNGSCPVLKIEAQTGAYPILKPEPQQAIKGQQDAGGLIAMLANSTGKTFRNDGVSATVSDCVITGDPVTKMRQVANAVGADLLIDDDEIVLLPRGKQRSATGTIPVLSAQTGMIGYPTFSSQGITANSYFRPDFKIGAAVRIESIVPFATGVWKIVSLKHELTVNSPTMNAWRTSIEGMWLNE